jgi:hypothetical protein
VLLLAASVGVNTGDALDYLGPCSVFGALVIGELALLTRRLRLRPRAGDAAGYLAGMGTGALGLLPAMLVWQVVVFGEARFDELDLAPAIGACIGVGALSIAGQLIAEVTARVRRRAER